MEMENYATEDEIAVVVKFDYQPEEQPVFYPNDLADPGCNASIDIYQVMVGDVDILDDITPAEFDRLAADCWDYVEQPHDEE